MLFQDALGVNGISSTFVTVQPTSETLMLVRDWSFGTPSLSGAHPYSLVLVAETGGSLGMVPLPSNSQFGDITSLSTIPGQNTSPPSEKAFTKHFIVKVIGMGSGSYFDPSYGAIYATTCDFESKAIAAYAAFVGPLATKYAARKASGTCTVSFSN